jgi:hypothetical protein
MEAASPLVAEAEKFATAPVTAGVIRCLVLSSRATNRDTVAGLSQYRIHGIHSNTQFVVSDATVVWMLLFMMPWATKFAAQLSSI